MFYGESDFKRRIFLDFYPSRMALVLPLLLMMMVSDLLDVAFVSLAHMAG